MPIRIEPEFYLTAFQKGETIRIRYLRFQLDDVFKIYDVVEEILLSNGTAKLVPFAKTSLKEMIQNAVKATQKRFFFQQQGFDIRTQYQKGMEKFHEFLSENKNMSLPPGIDYSAEVCFENRSNTLHIFVKNYGEITEQENNSLRQMFSRGRSMNSVPELLENEVKLKEGGGLGVSMILVLGKSLGIKEPLSYKSQDGFTEFCLQIPLNI